MKHVKRTIYTKVEQFLRDDEFIRYVMDCEPDKESYWASYLTAVPEIRTAYLKAYDILMHLDDQKRQPPLSSASCTPFVPLPADTFSQKGRNLQK